MLSLILGFITGLAGPIAEVINRITALKEAKVKAESDKELSKINAELEQVHDRKAVLVAEAGNRVAGIFNAITRGSVMWLFALPILIKFAYDKVMGSFAGCGTNGPFEGIADTCYMYSTDKLDPNMWWVIIAVIGFYFLTTKR